MAAGIITALCTFVATNLGSTVWDGETHRYDPQGQTVGPESSAGLSDWPVVKFSLPEGGFDRQPTFEEAYHDEGLVVCQIWHHTRAEAEATMDRVEALLASLTNWGTIGDLIPSPYPENPHYVVQLLLKNWTSYHLERQRTQKSELLYTCEMHYLCFVHGAVPFIPCQWCWTKVSLAAVVNATLATRFSSYPSGTDVLLGGTPFSVPAGVQNTWEATTGNTTAELSTRIERPRAVEVLLNTIWGQPGPTSYAKMVLIFHDSTTYEKTWLGDADCRDYFAGVFTNTINNTTTVNVFTQTGTGIEGLGTYRLDKARVEVPSAHWDKTLVGIRFVDTGGETFQRMRVSGVTVQSLCCD